MGLLLGSCESCLTHETMQHYIYKQSLIYILLEGALNPKYRTYTRLPPPLYKKILINISNRMNHNLCIKNRVPCPNYQIISYLRPELIFVTNITNYIRGEKNCHVEKFQLSIQNLNNLWSFIKVYAVLVPNLCGEKSVRRKSVWRKNDKYEV